MENTTYIALSRLSGLRRQMDIVANNLANMNTTAYKAEKPMFQEVLVDVSAKSSAKQDKLSFVRDYGSVRNTKDGTFEKTESQFDVAIAGSGYFAVDTPVGVRYTRNGKLRLDSQGNLTDSEGNPLLGPNGQRINVSVREGTLSIAPDGTVSTLTGPGPRQVAQVLGRLSLYSFDNPQLLRTTGAGLYAAPEGVTANPAVGVALRQGYLEGSNVEPINELVAMMEVQRNYQSASEMVDADATRLSNAIQRLSKVGTA